MTRPADRTGWFSDIDRDEGTAGHVWRPYVQLPGAFCPGLAVWFATKQECDRFIVDTLVGQPMLESP